ncbi:hypothetical protein R6Q59_033354 [Mikania micrantha]
MRAHHMDALLLTEMSEADRLHKEKKKKKRTLPHDTSTYQSHKLSQVKDLYLVEKMVKEYNYDGKLYVDLTTTEETDLGSYIPIEYPDTDNEVSSQPRATNPPMPDIAMPPPPSRFEANFVPRGEFHTWSNTFRLQFDHWAAKTQEFHKGWNDLVEEVHTNDVRVAFMREELRKNMRLAVMAMVTTCKNVFWRQSLHQSSHSSRYPANFVPRGEFHTWSNTFRLEFDHWAAKTQEFHKGWNDLVEEVHTNDVGVAFMREELRKNRRLAVMAMVTTWLVMVIMAVAMYFLMA